MHEQKEIKIKKALLDFVTKEFKPQGDPQAVLDINMHFVDSLFSLFIEFNKYTNPPESPKKLSTV